MEKGNPEKSPSESQSEYFAKGGYAQPKHWQTESFRPVASRHKEEYEEKLHMKLTDYKGKRILDVGSGFSIFAGESQQEGVEVVALDPLYTDTRAAEESPADTKVAGIAEHLPFKEESFDAIFSIFDGYYYTYDPERIKSMLRDQVRVLKPGGEIRIFPGMMYLMELPGFKPSECAPTIETKWSSEDREPPSGEEGFYDAYQELAKNIPLAIELQGRTLVIRKLQEAHSRQ